MPLLLLTVAGLWCFPPSAAAQSSSEAPPPLAAAAPSRSISLYADAPPAPIAPDVITRDGAGRATVRAMRISQPLRIDGVLDEMLYREVRSISEFIQVEPEGGQAATERTEAWVAFDDDYVYVSFKAWDSQMETMIATEMRRDSTNNWQGNDLVSFIFDTFYDRRSSFTFTVNPLGGRSDGTMINDRQYSSDWNPVWETKTGRFEGGWIVETAVPFKSLRYQSGTTQVWGFNAMRVKRSKNEVSTLTLVPPARGQSGFQQAQFAASLVGIEAPRAGANMDLKPYAISSLTTDRAATPRVLNHPEAEAGLDLKYGVTQGLVADLTVNTDFAQVEADEQQINLTRFSLFFPEKRDFFLENQGTFSFGGVAINSAGGNFSGGAIGTRSDAPIMFYSRRIGLNEGRQVPLNVGGRISGRAEKFSIGVLNIQTGKEEQTGARDTNFSVIRAKRDVLRRSSVGLLFTNRSVSTVGSGGNRSYGVDGTFAFLENLQINTYWAGTDTDGLSTRDTSSYRGQLDYSGDRYTVQIERLKIGDNFKPEMGFLRRDDIVRDYARFRFSPRPQSRNAIRKYVYDGSLDYIENGAGRLEFRERAGEFALEFQSADRFSINYTNTYEFLPQPFPIGGHVVLPVGGYQFDTVRVGYNLGQQRLVSANLSAEFGTFYNGHKRSLNVARGRVPITTQLSVEPTYSFNHVTLAQGQFITHLAGSRVTYSMTPLMFVSALLQYNSGTDAVSTNARFRWEYRPGSELFVVYNEERNTLTRSFPSLNNRAFIVKINRLFRV
jgi:hypothetical protein